MAARERGWTVLFQALAALREDDLPKTVQIRGKGLTVLDAITTQISHGAYHAGQIVYVAKLLRVPFVASSFTGAGRRGWPGAWFALARANPR